MNAKQHYKNITLGEWLDVWFVTYKRPYLRPYSLRNIEQMIRLHTPAWLKAMRMRDICVLDLDKALAELPNGRTMQYARQTWHNAFAKAYKLGIIERNVVELTDAVKYKRQRGNALNIKERRDFLEAIKGKRLQWLMLFYMLTGVRRTEALTLEWSDIDEDERLILIRGTKTEGSYRSIPLTDDLKYVLSEQRKQNEADKLRKGRGKFHEARENMVFPFSAEYVSRTFKELCPAHHLHDLRHTYITLCAESGVNVRVCQQLVGHSTAALTLNVYTHVIDDYKRKEAAKFTLFPSFGG
ncbi:MAG TPA: site-specific integrase [Firmicutes bacterium]|nr:site-specific integrase [Bacillota bacterium]